MLNKFTRKMWDSLYGFMMRRARNLFWMFNPPKVVIIHTPKCAGTYLHRQYNVHRKWHIKSVGHSQFRSANISSEAQVVGLIREPLDWYASYYFFCKNNLYKEKQSIYNFPDRHPISVFSKNSNTTLEQMILNMSDEKFLENILKAEISGSIYGKNVDDIFEFMKRTESGFWTWTMMYHFSKRDTQELKSKLDVIEEAKNIAIYVDFIHKEKIDEDISEILNLPVKKGRRINKSPRPSDQVFSEEMKSVIKKIDGEAAYILGGYQ